jgi:hypothetical protein
VGKPLLVGLALVLVAAAPLHAAEPNQLTPDQIADGWISLFDGETLFGWQPTSDANWSVENGEIRVSSGNQGFLMTTSEVADYALHVEFKAPPATNSGVFLRTPLEPKDPARDCIELNIAPADNPFPTGSLVGRIKAPEGGWTAYPLLTDELTAANAAGWSTFDVTLTGSDVTIALNGRMYSYDDATALQRGHIGLQFREGEVAFRNIRLKPLGFKPMLNGKDLAGWRTDQTHESRFVVTASSGSLPSEGRGPESSNNALVELHVTSGPGELETEASHGDFVMQLECFVDGDGLNSGVFFRSIPGDYANGYESQIQNAVKDGDPTKPVDAGTGAIYRRTTARRVVSKDREWFAKTIVATGPHIAVWVNGYQVTDWTDERPPHENPRNGQRLKPGTISLQGHDPTTNLRFRKLRIAELPVGAD